MAKTKAGTKKTDGKAKVKIPKEIAGFKVPKELRKKGEALIERANSPEGRQAIASGLAMVGGLVAANAANAARKAEAKASETAKPEAARPEASKDASKPETAKPETAKPETAKPETAKPGTPGINPQQMADQIGAAADMLLGRIFAKR